MTSSKSGPVCAPSPRRPLTVTVVRLTVLLIVLVLSSIAIQGRFVWRQELAVRQLEQLGASILYDYNSERVGDYSLLACDGSPPGPRWMRAIVGERAFGRALFVNLGATSDADRVVTDDDLSRIHWLPYLEYLYLDQTGVGDGVFDHIEGLDSLKVLDLSYTDISDDGIARIQASAFRKSLREVWLSGTQVTPEGAMRLRKQFPKVNIHYERE